MFVARRQDGTIYGMWTVRQFDGQEELPDDHPDVLAGPVKLPPQNPQEERVATDEIERVACKIDAQVLPLVNQTKAEWGTWAGANFPTLTGAERTRLGILFWVVSVGVRRSIRNGA